MKHQGEQYIQNKIIDPVQEEEKVQLKEEEEKERLRKEKQRREKVETQRWEWELGEDSRGKFVLSNNNKTAKIKGGKSNRIVYGNRILEQGIHKWKINFDHYFTPKEGYYNIITGIMTNKQQQDTTKSIWEKAYTGTDVWSILDSNIT